MRGAAPAGGGTMPPVPPLEPSPFPLADAALAYLERRRWVLVRLERLERALRRWDAWETNALLPEELQRPADRPVLPRGCCPAGAWTGCSGC